MYPRLLIKGALLRLLFLFGIAVATLPVASRAATPPGFAPVAAPTKENVDDASNPYAVIVERNIFHLNPPPPPPEPEKPKVELPVVKITGFVNVGSHSKVLFVSQLKNKKDEQAYYSLAEGEKSPDGKFELVRIHPAQEAVDVINDGVAVTLTVKDDSLLPSTGPTAPAAGAAPAGATTGPPTFNPGNVPNRQIFQRFPQPPGGANPFQPRGRQPVH
jgi:hypothetical protein